VVRLVRHLHGGRTANSSVSPASLLGSDQGIVAETVETCTNDSENKMTRLNSMSHRSTRGEECLAEPTNGDN
jgi:hypothetical protein